MLNSAIEVMKISIKKRLMPWFRAKMTAWLYEFAKKELSKHSKVYSSYQLDIGSEAFERAFVTHRKCTQKQWTNLRSKREGQFFYSVFRKK